MSGHFEHLRIVGFGEQEYVMALNMIAGGDVMAMRMLGNISERMDRQSFMNMLRLLDGLHLYGSVITKSVFEQSGIHEFIVYLTGRPTCKVCHRECTPAEVLEHIHAINQSLEHFSKILPKGSHLGRRARNAFDRVKLLGYRKDIGSVEFFGVKYGELSADEHILDMF